MGKGERNRKKKAQEEMKEQKDQQVNQEGQSLGPDLSGQHKRPSRKVSRQNVPSVVKTNMLMLERIYAEHGMVVGITKDGEKVVKSPREALYLAQEINSMPVGPVWKNHKEELVRNIIKAYKEASNQLEDSSNSQHESAHVLRNMAMGRAPDGGDILNYGKEDSHVGYYAEMCPHLKDYEIAAILRQAGDAQVAHQILLAEEFDRAAKSGDAWGKLKS